MHRPPAANTVPRTKESLHYIRQNLDDINQRMSVLEAHAEKQDALVKLLRDHTMRLVRDKEVLLMHLGLQKLSEQRDPLKKWDINDLAGSAHSDEVT